MVVGTRLRQEGLSLLLEREAGVSVVGACRAGDAIAMASERSPDVIVIESPVNGRSTLPYLPALMKLRPAPRLIMLGQNVSREDVVAAVELGVDACVSEEDGSEQVVSALEAVRGAQRYMGPIILGMLQRGPEVNSREDGGADLTPREREVLELIVQGNTERQIGRQLGRSPKTVHAHRTRIMKKLGAHNVIGLLRRAVRLGLTRV